MEAASASETSATFYQPKKRNNPEDTRRRENLKSHRGLPLLVRMFFREIKICGSRCDIRSQYISWMHAAGLVQLHVPHRKYSTLIKQKWKADHPAPNSKKKKNNGEVSSTQGSRFVLQMTYASRI
jgi:hypothetical protein